MVVEFACSNGPRPLVGSPKAGWGTGQTDSSSNRLDSVKHMSSVQVSMHFICLLLTLLFLYQEVL